MQDRIFFELSRIDQSKVQISRDEIRRHNPQRFELAQLDGVFLLLPDEGVIAGYKDVRADEFWVRGHIPGRPLFPGVLMVEAAAQLCSVYQAIVCPGKGFFGFGGLDQVKFRAAVYPGSRLILLGRAVHVHRKRSIFDAQGVVDGQLVFEGRITGIAIPGGASDGAQQKSDPAL